MLGAPRGAAPFSGLACTPLCPDRINICSFLILIVLPLTSPASSLPVSSSRPPPFASRSADSCRRLRSLVAPKLGRSAPVHSQAQRFRRASAWSRSTFHIAFRRLPDFPARSSQSALRRRPRVPVDPKPPLNPGLLPIVGPRKRTAFACPSPPLTTWTRVCQCTRAQCVIAAPASRHGLVKSSGCDRSLWQSVLT